TPRCARRADGPRRLRARRTTRRASRGRGVEPTWSQRSSRGGRRVGGLPAVTDLLACDVVLEVEQVGPGALGDREQRRRGGDLLDLLLEEPQQELLAERVALLARRAEQLLDLGGDLLFLLERKADRGHDVVEVVAHLARAGDRDRQVTVEHVLDDHHRVVALLERLAVVVPGQLRKVVPVEPHGDRDVLLVGVELVPDLLAQQLEEPGLAHGPNVVARGVSRRGKTVPSGKTRRSGKPAP